MRLFKKVLPAALFAVLFTFGLTGAEMNGAGMNGEFSGDLGKDSGNIEFNENDTWSDTDPGTYGYYEDDSFTQEFSGDLGKDSADLEFNENDTWSDTDPGTYGYYEDESLNQDFSGDLSDDRGYYEDNVDMDFEP